MNFYDFDDEYKENITLTREMMREMDENGHMKRNYDKTIDYIRLFIDLRKDYEDTFVEIKNKTER